MPKSKTSVVWKHFKKERDGSALCKFCNKKKAECVVKTHDRSETFVLQGNIVIIHQSLLNSIDCVYYSFINIKLYTLCHCASSSSFFKDEIIGL
jgi:hypothetical protein